MNNIKIALPSYMHGAGGAEHQLIMLANELAERNNDVFLLIFSENKIKYKTSNKIKIIDFSSDEKLYRSRIYARFILLKNFYSKYHPDVTIHFWLQTVYLSILLPKKITGKMIYSERGDPSDAEYHGILGIVRYLSFLKVDSFVFQSKNAMNCFNKTIKNKSYVIANPIDLPKQSYLSYCKNRKKIIINVGRLHPQKNQSLLIKAFAKAHKNIPEYILEIYGDGPLKSELSSLIKELKMDNYIMLKGTTNNVLNKIYESALFVLSSDFEGMPNVLLEAMSLGVPCISTNYSPGGVEELIHTEENGWIVEKNNLDELSNKIIDVLKDEKVLKKISINAMTIRKAHDKKSAYDKWERVIYDKI